jgi:hypothetical protein
MSAVFDNRWSLRSNWMPAIGGSFGFLCALHCALVPLLFSLMPTLKLALLSVRDPNHDLAIAMLTSLRFERSLVWTGIAIALMSVFLAGNWREKPLAWYALGIALTLTGTYLPIQWTVWHSALMVAGGCVMLFAALKRTPAALRAR